jgi:ribosomal protein S18 acetylase RimI-like enzyme
VDPVELLDAFDAQVRRSAQPDGPGARIEVVGTVVRQVARDGQGWSGITWSQLAVDDADAAVAGQVAYFRGLGQEFEWKLYDYDRPPDLAQRLVAAGFRAEDEEALMVADVADIRADVDLPEGVRLVPVTSEAGVALLVEVHERVFGAHSAQLRQLLMAQLRQEPERAALVVAMAGAEPVCSARMECLPGRDFASLWGGGTVPGWRGRGIYRALVAYRARLAAARGYRYLHVDASAASQPILSRLGFVCLARTTPYVWRPGAGRG